MTKLKARSVKNKSTVLSKTQLEQMLSATYKPKSKTGVIDNYVPDPTLSDNNVKVFYNKDKNHTVVAHRGSQSALDWMENALYAAGIKRGVNWSHSKRIQKKAEEKYGTQNLTTIGHSKGALHAQEFGKKGDIVTLNKPVNIPDLFQKVPDTQLDYVGEGDAVSLLRPLQAGNKAVVLSKGLSTWQRVKRAVRPVSALLNEHKIDTLRRIEKKEKKTK
jgi:hypothetical protein